MRHATILVAILAFTPLASATAQVQQPPIELGARVRVTMPPPPCPAIYAPCTRRNMGTFLAWKADTLVMESNGDTLAVPLDIVIRLEVGQGQKRHVWEGALLGLGVQPSGWVPIPLSKEGFGARLGPSVEARVVAAVTTRDGRGSRPRVPISGSVLS